MALSATFANELAKLIFHGTAIAELAAVAAPSAAQLWISLHTDDPSAGNAQSTHEVAYPGYARVALDRSDKSWDILERTVQPRHEISFADVTGKVEATLATHFGIGLQGNGAGRLLIVGLLEPRIPISESIRPVLLPRTRVRFN